MGVDPHTVVRNTRQWISSLVIGLNLCPFAGRVFDTNGIRYSVSDARDESQLLQDLAEEMRFLSSVPLATVETTLLIFPHLFGDFLDYNDFLDAAEQLLADLGQEGILQIASFHPEYQFADAAPDAVENFTNRSPYPMLHLLREESITAVAGKPKELRAIPRRNIATLRQLGIDKTRALLRAIQDGEAPEA